MKKLSAAVAATIVLVSPNLFADITSTLNLDLSPTGYRDTSTVGGEFTAIVTSGYNYAANYNPLATATINGVTGFETFCIEFNEEFTPGNSYTATANSGAVNGGVGGQTSPNFDPLSIGTAWLYSQFAAGTLQGYNYTPGMGRETSATELQDAIWYLENEIPNNLGYGFSTFDPTTDYFLNLVVTNFGSLAYAMTNNANGAYGVVALNLTDANGGNAQDQLAILPTVPEPATIVAGAMLLLPLGVSTLRILRRNRLEGGSDSFANNSAQTKTGLDVSPKSES